MTIARPCYANILDLQAAKDVRTTARRTRALERVLEEASANAEGLLSIVNFYPLAETRRFDWPNWQCAPSWRFWLDENPLISLTSATSGGQALNVATEVILHPHDGPPYDRVEIDTSSSAAFSAGDTWQDSLVLTGVWGWSDDTSAVCTLAEDLDISETGVDISPCAELAAGDLVTVGTEKMLVTGASLVDTTATADALAASKGATAVTVSSGALFVPDDQITIDAERMSVLDIAGNVLSVERAVDGSTLAAHGAAAKVYAPRTLTVVRGAVGTTAATHATSAPVLRQTYPPLLKALVLAEAMDRLEQEASGYARIVGVGDSARPASGRALAQLRETALRDLGRQARTEAI